ncbi:MAG: NAD(P)-binding domain-containing protein, partial [Candidatus Acidiferrales bacterium]
MLTKLQRWFEGIFETANMPTRRPELNASRESNLRGLYVIGDLAGAPVIKLAMEQGVEVIEHVVRRQDARSSDPEVYDAIVVGAGAAGLNAALAAVDKGLRCVVLEKNKIANTIEDFPEGKWIYAEPDEVQPKGKLWLDGATKEDLIGRWHQIIRDN